MTELMDLRMHHHIALQTEFYRHQMLQRLPDPYPTMLPVPPPARSFMLPSRYNSLPDVDIKLQNRDLWSQFHKIGTEMIITKSGRRMFPSMRLSVSGLEPEENYFVLLEMVPISDCRFKFSGSQWVPAGGAEPQSPQRIYFHPDSPSLGSHWTSQPIVFNKVKLTNNTLDSSGHIVLTSMHKYQPRIHVIKASDAAQIPWANQQAFTFPETEFVAVTAYQNDRITKLKIDNNPFAKGFRETGQSRCKRKAGMMGASGRSEDECESGSESIGPEAKRIRTVGTASPHSSLDDSDVSVSDTASSGTSSPVVVDDFGGSPQQHHHHLLHQQLQQQQHQHHHHHQHQHQHQHQHHQHIPQLLHQPGGWIDLMFPYQRHQLQVAAAAHQLQQHLKREFAPIQLPTGNGACPAKPSLDSGPPASKKLGFSISAILGHDDR